jgi:hypothetical protein
MPKKVLNYGHQDCMKQYGGIDGITSVRLHDVRIIGISGKMLKTFNIDYFFFSLCYVDYALTDML